MSQILPLSLSEADIGVHFTPGAKHWRFRRRGESGRTGPDPPYRAETLGLGGLAAPTCPPHGGVPEH
jgi:hypothetical protein